MITADLHHLIDDQSLIAAMGQKLSDIDCMGIQNQQELNLVLSRIDRYIVNLRRFGLEIAARHAEKLKIAVGRATYDESDGNYLIEGRTLFEVRDCLNYLHNGGLSIEAETRKYLVIDPRKAAFLEHDFSFFGADVDRKFPSIIEESQEAAKCFALSRWTASAFHFLRCLEVGIRAICRSLAIPDPTQGSDRNWSNISRSIKNAMDAKWVSKAEKMSDDYLLFDQVHASIQAMQNPYRNETMHFSAYYSEDEARHLSEMVRGLIQRVAARCNEDGKPLA